MKRTLLFGLALCTSGVFAQNLVQNGEFDDGGTSWSWWGGGGYFYLDGTDTICSLGWWEDNAIWQDTTSIAELATTYKYTIRARTGDGQARGIKMTFQTTDTWADFIAPVDGMFPEDDRGLVPGPWREFTYTFNTIDYPQIVGKTFGMGARIHTTSPWGQAGQWGWVHFDSVRLEKVLPGVTISGKIVLQDFDTAAKPGEPLTVEVRKASDDSLIETKTVKVDSNDAYAFNTEATGDVVFVAKGRHWLTDRSGVLTLDGAKTVDFSLINGDIDGDNAITVFDYGVLSDYFDKSSGDADWNTVGSNGFAPEAADLDGDGSVTVFDYGVLSNNFDLVGE